VRHLPFGTPADVVRAGVARALGPLTTTTLPDCGQGPRTASTVRGFTVLVDGTRFVGWTDQGAPGRHLSTMNGVGVGSTLTQLRGELTDVRVERTTLGIEWLSASGLHGLLTSAAAAGRVTVVYGGEVCSFG
jgi:hypothetical protein